jgi:uncharacterized membrane protein YeaQ/YmgE (transglycosylase-associated protein family)
MIEIIIALPYAAIGAFIRTSYGIWKAITYDHCTLSRKKILLEFLFSLAFGILGATICSEIGYFKFATNIAAIISGILGANVIDLIVKKVGYTKELQVNVVEKVKYPDLNQNQRRAMDYLEQAGRINLKIYQQINNLEKRSTAKWELRRMVDLGYLKKCGKGKGTYYILNNKRTNTK